MNCSKSEPHEAHWHLFRDARGITWAQGQCHARSSAPAGLPLHEPTDRDADNIPSESDLVFRQERGEWVITGSYDGPDNVVIYRDGAVVRSLTVPGYKIWNYAAHFADIIADIEAEAPDNVPSDRARAYADAFRARKGPRCAECLELDDWSDCAECDAVVAVEVADREQAELRAEVERLHGRLADSERTITDLSSRVKRREATIARVEALAAALTKIWPGVRERRRDVADMIRAALRGPKPTDVP